MTPVILGAIATLSLGLLRAHAELEVSAGVQIHAKADFVAPLTPYGGWVEVGSYGRCWRPSHVVVGWQPYCEGRWVWTDCGWYWESDEPWGWACYHYGWWVNDPAYGWVWVPDVEWAPCWVSWRIGGGFVGWAPLPPPGWFFIHHPAPSLFVFVGAAHFGDPVGPRSLIVNNTTIIRQTTEISEIKHETRNFTGTDSQKVVVNRGPGVEIFQKATGRAFTPVPIREAVLRAPTPATFKRGPSGPSPDPARTGAAAESKPSAPEQREGRGDERFGQPAGGQSDHGTLFGGDRGGGGRGGDHGGGGHGHGRS
ncbi:MAG TPA: DUF6600 domain-containing protein [Candidatus Binatia bacterium]|nr:DUF6600 domain-containing protein [Candidatus Binatia bacterium]